MKGVGTGVQVAPQKVLVAGLGSIGQRHVRNLRALLGSQVEIIAYRVRNLPRVIGDRPGAGDDVQGEYGLRVFHDLDEALAQAPQAALVCNPTSLHLPVALAAARAGCHLFIEKPLAHDLEGVPELIRVAESRSLVTLVGYQMRFHPCLRRLRALLEQGAVGQVLAARIALGEYLPDWHPYEDYRQSYAARSELGGGVVLSQIHELDYAFWLFGLPRRVFALGGHLSSLQIDVEDVASILLECVVGERLVPVHVHLDYLQRPPTRTCEVIGDAGKILLDLRASRLSLFDCHGNPAATDELASLERNQLFMDEMRHFLRCLSGREQPTVSARDGMQSLRMALAARESLATGRVVELES